MWLDEWSPIAIIGDFHRELPQAAGFASELILPAAKTGLFWTAGNPAGLAWADDEKRAFIDATQEHTSGDLRRPLDPERVSDQSVSGIGWQSVASGALVGRASFNRVISDPSAVSLVNNPYSSSVFVLTDTSHVRTRQSRATMEGAGGWRLGNWGAGLALGYDTRSTSSVASAYVRKNRAVMPAATVGIARSFANGSVQVGLRAQARRTEETINLAEVFGFQGLAFPLEGYHEISGIDFQGSFFRRSRTDVHSAGIALSAKTAAMTWTLFTDHTNLSQRLWNLQQNDPPSDTWKTTSNSGGIALQLPVFYRRATATLNARYSRLDGTAQGIDESWTGAESNESSASATVEIRLHPTRSGWTARALFGGAVERRSVSDSIAKAFSDVTGNSLRAAAEIGKELASRLSVTTGYALISYSGSGSIPSSTGRPLFGRVFQDELDIVTSGITSQAVSAALSWKIDHSSTLWVGGTLTSLSGWSPALDQPMGAGRNHSAIKIGVSLLK